MDNTPQSWQQATAALGMIPRENWATIWPELSKQLDAVYVRVAQLPFVPGDWLSGVRAYAAAGTLMIPISATFNGVSRDGMPSWLADSAAAVAWDNLTGEINKCVATFANGERVKGLEEIDRLNRNTAFWDTLYTVAKTIADLPANAVKATLSGAESVFGGVFKALLGSPLIWGGILLVGGFIAYRLGFFNWRNNARS